MPKTHKPRARKDAIRLLREAKGWGQQALADRAVVSIKTINSVEQGKPAHLSTFAKIAKALGVEPSEILEGYDPSAHLAGDTIRALSKRVEVEIKLSIPFEDFDEAEGLTNLVQMLSTLIKAKQEGKRICGYGAPGKGNTLLNYAGIGTDFLDFTVDRNPYKHGRYTPGMHIPIRPVEAIDEAKPDYILILPWNLKQEIVQQMRHVGDWGAKFIVPIPSVSIIDPNRLPG